MRRPNNLSGTQFITAKEVERITAIPVGTLGQWRNKGIGFPYIKLPEGGVRYDRHEVIAYMARGRRTPSVRAHMEEIAHGGV